MAPGVSLSAGLAEHLAGRFAATLATLATMAPAGRLALAVSGGADSVALLMLAAAARPGDVVAATVDHGLRPDAAAEAAQVAAACRARGIPHATLPVRLVPGRGGLQAAARAARYAALELWAREAGAAWLLTAHHADDQAETLLMRLARGAGVAGLAGIRPRRELGGGLTLLRPLLGWRRIELAEIVARAGLVPIDDPSNRDPRHDRTRVRALLAREPLLDPVRLAAAARHLADGEEALAWTAALLWRERARGEGDRLRIDVDELPRELRRRLLVRALPGARGDAVARLLMLLDGGRSGTLGGWHARPHGRAWHLAPAPPRRERPTEA